MPAATSIPVRETGLSAEAPSGSRSIDSAESFKPTAKAKRSSVTVIVPVFNEEAKLAENAESLLEYLETISGGYSWEVLFVNDGSSDRSAEILDEIEAEDNRIRVVHHLHNRGLCEAMKTGFANCPTDYAVTIDCDLSYSPEHIGRMLEKMEESGAEIVLASPYMEGGQVTNVPFLRQTLSVWANRFLSRVSPEHFSTFTGMVRAYNVKFLKSLDLKASSMDIMPEIIYKTLLLRGRVEEIPAHLDWSGLETEETPRRKSFGLSWHTLAILFSGFLFRPFLFFLLPGAVLFLLSSGISLWVLAHIGAHYADLQFTGGLFEGLKLALADTYDHHAYAFAGSGVLLILSVQLLSLGVLSMQNKRYFEEIFHLGTSIYRRSAGE